MKQELNTTTSFNTPKELSISLLALRLGIGIVFIMWGLDKILAPEHTIKVFQGFYGISISESFSVGLGLIQMAFLLAFLSGVKKNITYLGILIFHSMSTFGTFSKYLDPLNNLIFFAAWPMLAACLALYLLREYDTLLTFKTNKQSLPLANQV
ncbi:hypothetical protein N9R79_08525 [Vibrio sp.]|nr:hypothetical protein [Vibrio sp.]